MIETIDIDRGSYENIYVKCSHCKHLGVFNRASDLKTFEPIGGLDVTCLNENCHKIFRVGNDSINERHEMLVYDCYELLEHKQYMNCILNLCQAYEVFFSLFLRVNYLFKPYVADQNRNIEDFNRISEKLFRKIKNYTFGHMRALFLQKIIAEDTPLTLEIAEEIIKKIPSKPCLPEDSAIKSIRDNELVQPLIDLRNTDIHKRRNNVVHKSAYRPTRDEVVTALNETRRILFELSRRLELHDDVNMYL